MWFCLAAVRGRVDCGRRHRLIGREREKKTERVRKTDRGRQIEGGRDID